MRNQLKTTPSQKCLSLFNRANSYKWHKTFLNGNSKTNNKRIMFNMLSINSHCFTQHQFRQMNDYALATHSTWIMIISFSHANGGGGVFRHHTFTLAHFVYFIAIKIDKGFSLLSFRFWKVHRKIMIDYYLITVSKISCDIKAIWVSVFHTANHFPHPIQFNPMRSIFVSSILQCAFGCVFSNSSLESRSFLFAFVVILNRMLKRSITSDAITHFVQTLAKKRKRCPCVCHSRVDQISGQSESHVARLQHTLETKAVQSFAILWNVSTFSCLLSFYHVHVQAIR